eukprot:m.191174 g.191174  ORF g.191174 m.191174 type:complete len:335 (+) comp17565_c1_seq49:1753-2757(+)
MQLDQQPEQQLQHPDQPDQPGQQQQAESEMELEEPQPEQPEQQQQQRRRPRRTAAAHKKKHNAKKAKRAAATAAAAAADSGAVAPAAGDATAAAATTDAAAAAAADGTGEESAKKRLRTAQKTPPAETNSFWRRDQSVPEDPAKEEARTRREKAGLERRYLRALERAKNLVNDLHDQLVLELVLNNNIVLIPKFGSARMSRKDKRKLSKGTTWKMLSLAHYSFRQKLLAKAELYPWVTIIECTEEWTSKTCGGCGKIHSNLGGNKTFVCPHPGCGYVADRDLNAARNILLLYLTKTKALSSGNGARQLVAEGEPQKGTPNQQWSCGCCTAPSCC